MDHLLHVIHNLHWSTTAREGAHHCRYHSKVQGTGPPTYNTMCGACTTAIQYKRAHQLCASQRAVENGDGDCWGRSAELCPTMLLTDGGQWRSARLYDAGRGESWRRVSGKVQFLVMGEARRAHTTM